MKDNILIDMTDASPAVQRAMVYLHVLLLEQWEAEPGRPPTLGRANKGPTDEEYEAALAAADDDEED